MSDPVRWRSPGAAPEPAERRAAELLQRLGEPAPWSEARSQAVLRCARARLEQGAPRRRWVALAALGAAALLLVLLRPTPPPSPSPAPAEVAARADARYRLSEPAAPGEDPRLELWVGEVSVHPAGGRRLALQAPGLTATVEARAFRVQAAGERTTLWVDEGQALVGAARLRLGPGESIRSDDPRLAPRAPAWPTVADCARLPELEARRGCYQALAQGSDLAAQNALLALGMLEADERHDGPAAIADWRAYLERFPDGPLGPEASFAALAELLAERRSDEASAEAERFLSRFPGDARAGEVRLRRAVLACAPGAEAALAPFAGWLRGAEGVSRAEALFARAECLERLGHAEQARAAYRAYLREQPSGAHAAEAHVRAGE